MATISSQLLFLTTSPRTPEKMIPEIKLLTQYFENQEWNTDTQTSFMETLRAEDYFWGTGSNDPAFSARDRINRAPKALGFVSLSPVIQLTDAGKVLLSSKRKEEIFLRQMLKFQIPSPYHKLTKKAANFKIKPYLEIIRLVRTLGSLRFDELQIFGLQLVNWQDFDSIIKKIEEFRILKTQTKLSYRTFKTNYLNKELSQIYEERILKGETKTRESKDKSLEKFLKTQTSNTHDYADACFRYLRATGLISVSHIGKTLSIIPERVADVDFILENVSRDPIFIDDLNAYVNYLSNPTIPELLTDDKKALIKKINNEFPEIILSETDNIEKLKDLFFDLLENRKNNIINTQIKKIKDYYLYDDIQNTFEQIETNKLYDAPLMLEWNTWRAMTMLDGGNIKANLNFDDYGKPLSTAAGNMADIICDYDDYMLNVEVTMSSGQRQYEMEGEPVTRHLGKLKKSIDKPCYCLFIAPQINEACISHFFVLHHLNLTIYGGTPTIVPLPLNIFRKMLEDSYKANYIPSPKHVQEFFEYSANIAKQVENEQLWYSKIIEKALNWLS